MSHRRNQAEEIDSSTETIGDDDTFAEASDEVSGKVFDEDSDEDSDETSDDDIMFDGYILTAAYRKFRQLMKLKVKQAGFYLDANLQKLL